MIKEDYVSYEVAKLLKDRGFDEPCHCFYEYKKRLYNDMYKYFPNGMKNSDHDKEGNKGVSAPTHQMACRWLREVYNVVIEINSIWIVGFGYNYIARIVVEGESKKCLKHYNYYEEAVEAAIKYTLENLI